MKARFIIVLLVLFWSLSMSRADEPVASIRISGAISPATVGYVERAIRAATSQSAQCLIIELDTPGGLLESTKEIIQAFYASAVPIVVYVSPSGATAASAGCFITMAADVAAMAPDTTIGAAHPVGLGPGEATKGDEVMKQKMESFAATYIEAVAQKHGRNSAWAQAAVRQSASLTARAAKASNVVEILAVDLPDLLKQLDGHKVRDHRLRTAGAAIHPISIHMRERMFQMLWRPEILTLLMLVAIYGIIAEFSHPGAVLPGVAGFIALVLALYMSSVLPINLAGVALVLLAVGLFLTEAFTGASGWLTVGGIVSFFFGLLMLFDRADPVFRLSLRFILPATLITASFFIFIVAAGWRAQRLPVKSGPETMIGKIIPAITPINSQGGKVFVEGEYWNAVSKEPAPEGALVKILAVRGLTLDVTLNTQ
ncbi:MAG: hypothetical protein JWM16_1661 [Verrucomicrobiales bacterium]|nr:hypothetical protein [Verrucomicrobiales bacterium]